MKTIKLKNATLELSAEDIAELRKQLEEEATDWPQEDDEYWCIDDEGLKYVYNFEGSKWDNYRLSVGNAFKTEEELDLVVKKQKALTRIKDFIRKEGLEYTPNWKDKAEHKHFIRYDHDQKAFDTEWYWHVDGLLNPFYFKSEADTLKVIDNCEADLKILFNLK